ncbi:MAG TPA: hypothetical protein VLM40_20850 [Gemmata sp.]|nr:hypothetical protein [Gemmata sp.]
MKNLKNLVLKTAKVNSVKLLTPADRIGLGFGVAAYPTDNLSPGQVSMPHNPVPEQVRPREELSAMQMPEHPHAGCDPVPPASSAGCNPGVSARRFDSLLAASFRSWRGTTRTAAAGRTREVCLTAVPGQADGPRDLRHTDRLGRDCQSPDRLGDKRIAKRAICSAAAARK